MGKLYLKVRPRMAASGLARSDCIAMSGQSVEAAITEDRTLKVRPRMAASGLARSDCIAMSGQSVEAAITEDRTQMAGSGAGNWFGSGPGIGTGMGLMMCRRASAAVYQRFHAITHMPSQISTPPNHRKK